MIKAIDTCILAQVEDSNGHLSTIQDVMAQNEVQEEVFNENFLSKDQIKQHRMETDKRIILMRNLKVGTTKLWKPDKLRITKNLKLKFAFLNEK